MSYQQFAADVEVGEKVLVDDGKVGLEVVETNNIDCVKLKVLFGKELSSTKVSTCRIHMFLYRH